MNGLRSAPSVPPIRPAGAHDHKTIIAVLAEGFLHGDFAPWLVSDLADRERIYPAYFELCMERAFAHALIEVTDDLGGVAIWYPYDGRDIPDSTPGYDERLKEITGPYHDHFLALDSSTTARHPQEPHHYLAWVVVHPQWHNRGYGTALIRHHHAQLDGEGGIGLPVYLEATGDRNEALYQRLGYRSLLSFPVDAGDDAPRLRPMMRDPQ
ncbi:GNAT family N-acetyltransferase [Actinoplanes sp. NBRC 103695]|uniref:GNAT family N-acetyltransferase n=1 Tax=Actinoplanes sp. NBRC 103695 TaxID=3032202 RepID=UPI0024A5F2ED|nr:GNAT family N-acetyltransferase [Actinoplanes sp. NBRC 103695]GLY96549.1 N-acetyltransferase [Actinoplanes sp. NBRC 103695]